MAIRKTRKNVYKRLKCLFRIPRSHSYKERESAPFANFCEPFNESSPGTIGQKKRVEREPPRSV